MCECHLETTQTALYCNGASVKETILFLSLFVEHITFTFSRVLIQRYILQEFEHNQTILTKNTQTLAYTYKNANTSKGTNAIVGF